MKFLSIGMLLFLTTNVASAWFGISTVSSVDPAKFVGTWYRISSNPIIFEPACACARQVLSGKSDGTVGVYNTCNKDEVKGEPVSIKGYATPDDSTFTKLSVHFEGVSMTGSYWIVGLDEQYRWTVVTDSFGYSLYVMSRTPTLSAADYAAATAQASSNGVSVSKLEMQVQDGCSYPPTNP